MYIVLKLEDEFHFLLECTLYKDLRKKYVRNIIRKMLKLIELIPLENETVKKTVIKSFDLRINL